MSCFLCCSKALLGGKSTRNERVRPSFQNGVMPLVQSRVWIWLMTLQWCGGQNTDMLQQKFFESSKFWHLPMTSCHMTKKTGLCSRLLWNWMWTVPANSSSPKCLYYKPVYSANYCALRCEPWTSWFKYQEQPRCGRSVVPAHLKKPDKYVCRDLVPTSPGCFLTEGSSGVKLTWYHSTLL